MIVSCLNLECNPIFNSVNVYSYWEDFLSAFMLLDYILKIIFNVENK